MGLGERNQAAVKKRPLFLIVLAIFFLGLAGWWFWGAKIPKTDAVQLKPRSPPVAQSQIPTSSLSPMMVNALYASDQIRAGRVVNVMLSRNPNAVIPMTRLIAAGVTKEELTKGILRAQNVQPINVYGKVIDQYGDPVAGAKVAGNVLLNVGIENSGNEPHATTTDAQGLFQFTGLHGVSMGLSITKAGYEGNNNGYKAPNQEDKTSPDERDVITLWKLQGAEPMVHIDLIQARVACDGTASSFNLLNGKADDLNGDLSIKFTRNPVDIIRGKHFDYALTLQILDGGLIEIHDAYPYEAPENGYEQTATIDVSADGKDWSPTLGRNYYFKARNGQIYGRIRIHLTADYEGPTTHFEFELYANPAGSRNLEYDSDKEVTPK